jgi:RHS repeat-associated protein
VAPYVDVLGVANPTTNVTVNGNTANRKREYFHWPLNVPNSTPQYPNLTIVSQYGATQTQTGAVYVAASTESFQPDADGNLVSDGRWTYTWDGENRLVQMIRDTDTPAGARQKLVFEYDHQGRRIRKQFFTYSGGWQEQTDTLFLYDGWNLVAELNANSSNAKVRTYVWGSDLSGSMRGAGGVGGLLKVTYYGAATTNAFVAYDGNGNVVALLDAANGNLGARYEYGPFAEPLRISGTLGKANPVRFSTKYVDDESGLTYYGYRYYAPSPGRWLTRDPIAERAFRLVTIAPSPGTTNPLKLPSEHITDHCYRFVQDDPLNQHDPSGLMVFWVAAALCPSGTTATYAQVGWGGYAIWNAKAPFVDNGYWWHNTGSPEYGLDAEGKTDFFDDNPDPWGGPTQFVTCLLCTKPCCVLSKLSPFPPFKYHVLGHRVVQVGPCKRWKTGDAGDLGTFPDASQEDMKTFTDTVTARYPTWRSACYSCSFDPRF